MPQVVHIIGAVIEYDITVVVVAPASRPSLVVPEPIAAVLKAVVPADHLGTPHVERVPLTETGTVMVVRNAAIVVAVVPVAVVAVVAIVAIVVSNGLLLPPAGMLRLLYVLRLLLVLCLLRVLWLLLCVLRLLWLLCVLRLRLVLCLLGVLWLCLVLRLRCSSSTVALLLFALLSERGKGGAEKPKQNCRADNSIIFQRCCLQFLHVCPSLDTRGTLVIPFARRAVSSLQLTYEVKYAHIS